MSLLPNSIEGKAAPFLQRIENTLAEMESAKGKYMVEAKAYRDDIKDIYTEAKDAGVPAKALRGVVKYRALERKQDAIADGLDIDEQSSYEVLVEALGDFGDTELGAATISKAKPRNGKAEPDLNAIAAAMEEQDAHAAAKAEDAKAFDIGTEPATHQVL